ncbi:unnamed protein product [Sympodiomycopsis kandeliae]
MSDIPSKSAPLEETSNQMEQPSPEVGSTPTKQAGSEIGGDDHPDSQFSTEALPAQLAVCPPHPGLMSAKTAQSLSPSTDGLILFDLTNQSGGNLTFSPHCLKSIIDLKILNVGYERQRLSFVEVRSHLERRISEGVTVPSVELSDGSHLTDSWKIAEYLESRHPQGDLLFPNPAVKAFASFLNEFGKLLAPHISVLSIPNVANLLDAQSKDYFINSKLGVHRYQRALSATQEEKASHIEAAKKMSLSVEAALAQNEARTSRQVTRSKWLAGTLEPSHADACLFGWYVYTRPAGHAVTREIWHSHPHIANWIQNMLDWCGPEIIKDFV